MRTLTELLLQRFRATPEATMLHWREADGWREMTVGQCADAVARVWAWLEAAGVGPGDRVAVLGAPHPHWVIWDFATLLRGAACVGIYPTLLPDQIGYQLRDAGVRVLVVDHPRELARLEAELSALPGVIARVWDIPDHPPAPMAAMEALHAGVTPEATAALIYTSGTTGPPKGVLLTHRAFRSVVDATREVLPFPPGEVSICFLPLAHSLQRMTVFRAVQDGIEAYFCARPEGLMELLPLAKPSLLASVPRMLEKIQAGVLARVAAMPPARQAVFRWAMRVGERRSALLEQGRRVPLWLAARYALADRLVFRAIRERMGGRLRILVCGGAPLKPAVARFFHAMDILVLEGWGLSETTAPATLNTPRAWRLGTVGRPLPGTEVRLASDGEIWVRGGGLFSGYWGDPDATARALTPDGWFSTGDVGELTPDGFLRIVDRKKEILVTAGGKNVPPVNVERVLEGGPIAQAMVVGDARPYLVALVVPEAGASASEIEAQVRAANQQLAPFEQVKRYAVIAEAFSPENGLLTPTLKLRRKQILARYAAEIDELYQRA